MSTTSRIIPASFGVPSTLNTGIGSESSRVGISFVSTNFRSMNIPVAPQSTRAWRHRLRLVSVVSISMSMDRECCDGIAAIMYFLGSDRSQARIRLRRDAGIGGVWTDFTQWEIEIEGSIICSISNTSKGLCDCSGGGRFTHCDVENPPPPFLRL